MFYRHVLFFFSNIADDFFSSISFEKLTANYPDSRCGLSHKERTTLDYLSDEKQAIDELTLRKIIAMQEEGLPRFACEEKNTQHGHRHEIFEPSITVVDFVVLPRNRGM